MDWYCAECAAEVPEPVPGSAPCPRCGTLSRVWDRALAACYAEGG
jgi:hypothetical protein